MSLTVPHQSGVLLEGIDVRIAATEAGLANPGFSDLFCTMVNLNGFGAQRATQPNPHIGVLTVAGGNYANYITSVIVQQKEFTCDLVFAAESQWQVAIQKLAPPAVTWMQFTLPPEEGFISGDGFRMQVEITDWTLKGDIGGRVMVTVKVTPKSKMTGVLAVVAP